MEYSRITKKGQITIPLKFREILNIKPGEKFFSIWKVRRWYLKKLPKTL